MTKPSRCTFEEVLAIHGRVRFGPPRICFLSELHIKDMSWHTHIYIYRYIQIYTLYYYSIFLVIYMWIKRSCLLPYIKHKKMSHRAPRWTSGPRWLRWAWQSGVEWRRFPPNKSGKASTECWEMMRNELVESCLGMQTDIFFHIKLILSFGLVCID